MFREVYRKVIDVSEQDKQQGSGGVVPERIAEILSEETLKLREKLKAESGKILSVGDTQMALDALNDYMQGKPVPNILTKEQKQLVDMWIARLEQLRSKPE